MNHRIERIRLVMPAEIQKLRPLAGYIAIAGYDRAMIILKPTYLVEHHPAFIPRPATVVAVKEAPFSRTELGVIYYGIRARTLPHGSDKHKNWKDYGGRGIALRLTPDEFKAEMGERPSPKHSVDRFPNCDGHYEKGNLRWATPEQQSANRRDRMKKTNSVLPLASGNHAS